MTVDVHVQGASTGSHEHSRSLAVCRTSTTDSGVSKTLSLEVHALAHSQCESQVTLA